MLRSHFASPFFFFWAQLVPFCNKPMVLHQIEALARAGVTNVVLAVNYQPETMSAALDDFAARLGITITISIEGNG